MSRRKAAFVDGRRGECRVLLNSRVIQRHQYERLCHIEWCEFQNRAIARTIATTINEYIASVHRRA